uniref:Uncharacterized protein n=1 Tax=Physcomitrium patens TaxID=3218 RepID=A0A2K1KNK0_PHYPA|nr:hypothetical protein PHYPA_006247 [Physcomitrium patens]
MVALNLRLVSGPSVVAASTSSAALPGPVPRSASHHGQLDSAVFGQTEVIWTGLRHHASLIHSSTLFVMPLPGFATLINVLACISWGSRHPRVHLLGVTASSRASPGSHGILACISWGSRHPRVHLLGVTASSRASPGGHGILASVATVVTSVPFEAVDEPPSLATVTSP